MTLPPKSFWPDVARRSRIRILPSASPASKLPLVMWHGIGQSSKTWETTPDGREGFQTSSCVAVFLSTWSTNRDAAGRAAARCQGRSRQNQTKRIGSDLSPRHLARFLSGRAILTRSGSFEPILPPNHAGHRSARSRFEFRSCHCAL